MANVVGTEEPEYGAEGIRAVTAQAEKTPWTELKKEDLKWKAMESTCVETQTFYVMSDEGMLASVQMIYNNVGYVEFPSRMRFLHTIDTLFAI